MNFYAQGKNDDVDFDVYFDADTYNDAERIADENGWRLVGQEDDDIEGACAMIELMLVKPKIH